MSYPFSAMLSRMNYIDRWGLMRNSRTESLSEHTLATAFTAHLLAHIAAGIYQAEDVRPERVTVAALYHDISEIMTGDMPTPVKYGSAKLHDEYKKIERESAERIMAMLPGEIGGAMKGEALGDDLSEREKKILKAADKISALQKCEEEAMNGNTEFRSAYESTLNFLKGDGLPETAYYLKEFFPCFSMTLDELMEKQ